ncbi:M23/M56 family metallopeptidase [Hyphobacterium sp.]|uniref:M23/M56 family metallopeptidase n=1 Tax=Hyphobacterium sp. TaxID=2004662 RepID=UPI003B52CBC3
MSGLLDALLLGSALSLLAGGLIWTVLNWFSLQPGDVVSWRMARWASLAPILLSPLIYFIPETSMVATSSMQAVHPPMEGVIPSSPVQVATAPAGFAFDTGWVAALYLCGLCLSLLAGLRKHVRRHWRVRESRMPTAAERRLLLALGSADTPPVRVSPQIASPVLTGWNGLVLVPESLFDQPRALRFALIHEQAHFERGDERDRLVGVALKAIFWFHLPLRWIERELNAARELACDAEVLCVFGAEQRKAYAETLIQTMRQALPAASAFGPQDRRHRSMRIKAIVRAARPSRFRAICRTSASVVILGPLAVAQTAWTERQSPMPRVELVDAIAPPQPVTEPAPQPEPQLAERSFGAPVVTPEPNAVTLPEPQEASFGASDAPAPFAVEPVSGGRLTSGFGPRPERPAEAPRFHNGTDIAASPGTPIRAPAAGRVVHAGYGFDGNEAWGNTVAIDHGYGWQTIFGHMQGVDVQLGDNISVGTQIGRVGSSGRSTGPHVHLEVRQNGEVVDPADHIPGLR